MSNLRDYEIWLEIINTLYVCNKITYEDMYFIKGYFSAVMKPNFDSVSPMEFLFERMKGIKDVENNTERN